MKTFSLPIYERLSLYRTLYRLKITICRFNFKSCIFRCNLCYSSVAWLFQLNINCRQLKHETLCTCVQALSYEVISNSCEHAQIISFTFDDHLTFQTTICLTDVLYIVALQLYLIAYRNKREDTQNIDSYSYFN